MATRHVFAKRTDLAEFSGLNLCRESEGWNELDVGTLVYSNFLEVNNFSQWDKLCWVTRRSYVDIEGLLERRVWVLPVFIVVQTYFDRNLMNSLVRWIGGIQSEKHVFIVHLNDRWFDKHYIFRTFNSHHFMQPVLAKWTILSCPKRTCLITSDTITDCVLPFIYLPDDRPVSNIGQLVNQHVRQQFGALTASRYFHGKTRIFSQQKSQEWNVSYVGRYSSRKRPNIRRVWPSKVRIPLSKAVPESV